MFLSYLVVDALKDRRKHAIYLFYLLIKRNHSKIATYLAMISNVRIFLFHWCCPQRNTGNIQVHDLYDELDRTKA